MAGTIVMLPESLPLAFPLVEYVFGKNGVGAVDLLILSKQREAFRAIIENFSFREVHILDEEYYGGVTSRQAVAFMCEKAAAPYERAYFPFNTFRANAFLFGSIIAREAVAVNSSLFKVREAIPEVAFSLDTAVAAESIVPWAQEITTVRETLACVVRRLMDAGQGLEVSGERPNLGILEGFGHDLEIFMKYAYGIGAARGKKVLDIGGGLGYGSLLISKFAKEVVFLDRSADTADFVRRTWSPLAPNLTVLSGEAAELKENQGCFDVIFLMDVIEHVTDPRRLLFEVRELLGPGGTLVLSTPEEDYYPYRVCPSHRRDEDGDALLKEGIWPWHIQSLGERSMLTMLEGAGFTVKEKSYTTYKKGYELQKRIDYAKQAQDLSALSEAAREITRWDITDFGVTLRRDPCFSAASYNVVARKEG
ncbi:MAG: class I SAM-dependent methyltransferase [Thermodesulfobacteriota bacterium]